MLAFDYRIWIDQSNTLLVLLSSLSFSLLQAWAHLLFTVEAMGRGKSSNFVCDRFSIFLFWLNWKEILTIIRPLKGNNLSLAIQMIGISESMNLGIKVWKSKDKSIFTLVNLSSCQLGMDSKKMASIFNTATSRCWSCDSYNPVPGLDTLPFPSPKFFE